MNSLAPLRERLHWGSLVNLYGNSARAVDRWIAFQQALHDSRHAHGGRRIHDDIMIDVTVRLLQLPEEAP